MGYRKESDGTLKGERWTGRKLMLAKRCSGVHLKGSEMGGYSKSGGEPAVLGELLARVGCSKPHCHSGFLHVWSGGCHKRLGHPTHIS